MSKTQEKILKPKLGLLELAKQLGNVSQACKVMKGYILPLQRAVWNRRGKSIIRDKQKQTITCQ